MPSGMSGYALGVGRLKIDFGTKTMFLLSGGMGQSIASVDLKD